MTLLPLKKQQGMGGSCTSRLIPNPSNPFELDLWPNPNGDGQHWNSCSVGPACHKVVGTSHRRHSGSSRNYVLLEGQWEGRNPSHALWSSWKKPLMEAT